MCVVQFTKETESSQHYRDKPKSWKEIPDALAHCIQTCKIVEVVVAESEIKKGEAARKKGECTADRLREQDLVQSVFVQNYALFNQMEAFWRQCLFPQEKNSFFAVLGPLLVLLRFRLASLFLRACSALFTKKWTYSSTTNPVRGLSKSSAKGLAEKITPTASESVAFVLLSSAVCRKSGTSGRCLIMSPKTGSGMKVKDSGLFRLTPSLTKPRSQKPWNDDQDDPHLSTFLVQWERNVIFWNFYW